MENPPNCSPHATVTTLLPLLFSPDDSISLSPILLSKPTLQAHHYLSLESTDDRYWTCGTKDSQVVLARREIVESGCLEDIELGSALYSFDSEGELKSLVPVSIPSSSSSSQSFPILDIILLYEQDEQGGGEGEWKFLRLSAPSILINSPNNGFNALLRDGNSSSSSSSRMKSQLKPEDWFKTIQRAIESINKTSSSSTRSNPSSFVRENRPNGLDLSHYHDHLQEQQEVVGEDEFDEYGTRRKKTNNIKTREEMAEGEGTTPGAYGDSEDFWAGWSDNEDDQEERDSGIFVNDVSATRGKDIEKENDGDEDYWNGYGNVSNQVDDGRTDDDPTTSATATTQETDSMKPTVKTRSRRSSTVTPFNLSSLPTASAPSNFPTATAHDIPSSFLTLDSPAQPSSSSSHNTSLPPLASAVKFSSITSDSTEPSTETYADREEDESLRFALAGIWGLYQKKGTQGGSREEKMKKFERIVGEVLRS
ncbi:hypothetical protein JCM3765_003049 [Sporobolomyces pararoseus]